MKKKTSTIFLSGPIEISGTVGNLKHRNFKPHTARRQTEFQRGRMRIAYMRKVGCGGVECVSACHVERLVALWLLSDRQSVWRRSRTRHRRLVVIPAAAEAARLVAMPT